MAEKLLTRDQAKHLWKSHGGGQHGLRVEHYFGSHPNADEAFGVVHGNTVQQVRDEIDALIADDPERNSAPLTTTGFFREITSIFQRDA